MLNQWAMATQAATIGLFVLAVITALYVTRAVTVPLLLAIIVGTVPVLVFWTWMWGPIGAFLAVPIAMVTAGVLQHAFPPPERPTLP
jgi:predicted PurR-regulated permease PerM